jgi:hypothetical protein
MSKLKPPPRRITQGQQPHWWLREERIPLNQPKRFGLDLNERTLVGWHLRGFKSRVTGKIVKLEAIYIGQQLFTSIERVNKFIADMNGLEVA